MEKFPIIIIPMIKIKLVTHASTQDHSGFREFKKSMDKFKYDWEVLCDPEFNWSYQAYKPFYKWCKSNSEGYTHMLLNDSFDAVAIAPMSEIYEKYKETDKALLSCEKACYPATELEKDYPPCPTPHKFVNGGQFMFPIPMFIRLFEDYPMGGVNAQEWLTRAFLFENKGYLLDTSCDIFQNIAFHDPADFTITEDKRILNNYTKSKGVLIHNCGGQNCVPQWVSDLL